MSDITVDARHPLKRRIMTRVLQNLLCEKLGLAEKTSHVVPQRLAISIRKIIREDSDLSQETVSANPEMKHDYPIGEPPDTTPSQSEALSSSCTFVTRIPSSQTGPVDPKSSDEKREQKYRKLGLHPVVAECVNGDGDVLLFTIAGLLLCAFHVLRIVGVTARSMVNSILKKH